MPSGNTFSQLVGQWAAAATSGTLLTAKHYINGPTRNEPMRSVLSQEMSASLETFVYSGSYSIDEYFNNRYQNYYYVLKPDTAYAFNPGYTVLSGSQATGSAFDSLVIFSGSRQGWHIIAENSASISTKERTIELVFQGILTR